MLSSGWCTFKVLLCNQCAPCKEYQWLPINATLLSPDSFWFGESFENTGENRWRKKTADQRKLTPPRFLLPHCRLTKCGRGVFRNVKKGIIASLWLLWMWRTSPHDILSCGKNSPHEKCEENLEKWCTQFMVFCHILRCFVAKSVLQFKLFYCEITFFVKKIEPKMTNMRYPFERWACFAWIRGCAVVSPPDTILPLGGK